jgi:predicted glycosyltransferase
MGGYNTICEVLALGVPAVAIPRVHPRQEQLMRCAHFAERGLLSMLHPNRLSPTGLAYAVASIAESSTVAQPARFHEISHRGIETTAAQLASLLPVPVGAP